MKKTTKGKALPGENHPKNLVDMGTYEACPCCGAVYKQGRPWAETTISAQELAKEKGITTPAIYSKIRRGIISAYLGPDGRWIIPVIQPK
jgi:hypothetical protein